MHVGKKIYIYLHNVILYAASVLHEILNIFITKFISNEKCRNVCINIIKIHPY